MHLFVLCCIHVAVCSNAGCDEVPNEWQETHQYRLKSSVVSCQFLSDETMLLLLGSEAAVWNVSTGKRQYVVANQCTVAATDVARNRIIIGKVNGGIEVYAADTAKRLSEYQPHKAMITAIAVSEDGNFLASAAGYPTIDRARSEGDYTIRIVDTDSGRNRKSLAGHLAPVAQMRFLAQDKELLSVSNDKTLRRWDVDRETVIKTDGVAEPPQKWVDNGKTVVASGFFPMSLDVNEDEGVALLQSRVWNLEQWKMVRELKPRKEASISVSAFVGSPSTAATGNIDGTLSIWKVDSAEAVQSFTVFPNGAPVKCLSVSPSGQYILAGGEGSIPGFNALSQEVRAREPIELRLYRRSLPE